MGRRRIEFDKPAIRLDRIPRARRAQEFNIAAGQWATAGVGLLLIGLGTTLALLDALPRQSANAYFTWRAALVSIIVTLGYLCYRWRLGEPMSRAVLLIGVLWLAYGLLVTVWI